MRYMKLQDDGIMVNRCFCVYYITRAANERECVCDVFIDIYWTKLKCLSRINQRAIKIKCPGEILSFCYDESFDLCPYTSGVYYHVAKHSSTLITFHRYCQSFSHSESNYKYYYLPPQKNHSPSRLYLSIAAQ